MSPVTITKVRGGYKVVSDGNVHSKHTTMAKAQHQANLLRAVEHGWKPTGQPAKTETMEQAEYPREERLRTKPMRISGRRVLISPKRQKIGR